jgi:hypothetical protein
VQEGVRRPVSGIESPAGAGRRVSPEEEYARRLEKREARVAVLTRQHERLGNARLLLAVLVGVAVWVYLRTHAFPVIYLGLPVLAFAALVVWHSRVQHERAQALRAATFYREGLARVEDRWEGQGAFGERFDDPHHVYASDLDLFGPGSLFQLLCTARTRMGEETLARWLLAPASIEEVRQRHSALSDLAGRVDLREDLAVAGEEGTGVHPDRLQSWAQTPNELQRPWIKAAVLVLAPLAIATVTLWGFTSIAWPFLVVLLVEIFVLRALHRPIDQVLVGSEQAFEDLRLFAALLMRMEREPLDAAPLRALLARLSAHSLTGSAAIGRLATLVNLAGSRRNQLMAMLAVPLMYPLAVALAAEHWRSRHGAVVRTWIEVVGELEALISLAGYAYEHPADPFPELHEGPVLFEGRQLGHPLLPARRCVRNDVILTGPVRLLLVSGSNMSGKSTLLRAVGVNTVLAMAGAPVRAARLMLTPLRVGASIRLNDSLHEGSSRFYAEITRLRELLVFADQAPPLLYLLDELLMGTNSKDRQIGATGILKAFVGRGALGLVSTHDLALTHIEGLPPGALRNVHFQDELRNGQMSFDFRLREGVVEKSNGVELMRSVGLDV